MRLVERYNVLDSGRPDGQRNLKIAPIEWEALSGPCSPSCRSQPYPEIYLRRQANMSHPRGESFFGLFEPTRNY